MKPKGRPKKRKNIHGIPKIVQFSPRGKPGRPDEVNLSIEHFEALRLADYKGFNHIQSAKYMRISRATFGRIIREARCRVSEGLIDGKIIRIN